jgi:hypothetical protein
MTALLHNIQDVSGSQEDIHTTNVATTPPPRYLWLCVVVVDHDLHPFRGGCMDVDDVQTQMVPAAPSRISA